MKRIYPSFLSSAISEQLHYRNMCTNTYHRNNTFSVVLDAVAAAFDDAIPLATRRVLFGLLFISPVEEEEAEMVMLLQPLLALLMPAAGCNDDDTVICLPGEAKKKCRIIVASMKNVIHCDLLKVHTNICRHHRAMTASKWSSGILIVVSGRTSFLIRSLIRLSGAVPGRRHGCRRGWANGTRR